MNAYAQRAARWRAERLRLARGLPTRRERPLRAGAGALGPSRAPVRGSEIKVHWPQLTRIAEARAASIVP